MVEPSRRQCSICGHGTVKAKAKAKVKVKVNDGRAVEAAVLDLR